MKTLTLLLFTALAGFAQAQWDGTKGNLTVKTVSDAQHTAISVTESNRTILLLGASIAYTIPCDTIGCRPLLKTLVQYVPCVHDKFGPGASLFIFDMPVGTIKSVLITEWQPTNTEVLTTD